MGASVYYSLRYLLTGQGLGRENEQVPPFLRSLWVHYCGLWQCNNVKTTDLALSLFHYIFVSIMLIANNWLTVWWVEVRQGSGRDNILMVIFTFQVKNIRTSHLLVWIKLHTKDQNFYSNFYFCLVRTILSKDLVLPGNCLYYRAENICVCGWEFLCENFNPVSGYSWK